MPAEFDVFLKAALGFDFSGIGSGFSRGVDGFLGSGSSGAQSKPRQRSSLAA
ncbi:MAG: hypothetical protein J4G13_04465 [Dehalococcoidia bacterium]|nr:hypothetical protein [Dehalococcoidia bacterium]